MAQRGSRRRAAADRVADKPALTGWRLWLRRLFVWGLALAALGLLFLGVSVLFAARSLPSYDELKAVQPGQTIIVY